MKTIERTLLAATLIFPLLVPARAAPVAGPVVLEWALTDLECDPPTSVARFGCGSYGQLLFGPQGGVDCEQEAGAVEAMPVYLQPVRLRQVKPVSLPAGGPVHLPLPRGLAPEAPLGDPTQEPPVPCEAGSCFGPPGGAGGGEDWIAVADWHSWHGWTMGATIRWLSGMPASLFAVDSPAFTSALGPAISDAHVLAALCSVAQAVEAGGAPAPALLNLSFGRIPQPGELDPGLQCSGDTISCQIRRVLDHLRQLGTAVVASAGNHKEILFPAGVPGVLAAGTLDLAAFRWGGVTAPAWESPHDAAGLLPAYGICIPFDEGPQAGTLWPAPAGSSYASAVFSGWMAEGLLRGALPDSPVAIAPEWSAREGCFVLSQIDEPSCNAPANALLAQQLGQSPETCWSSSLEAPLLTIAGPVPPLAGGLLVPSLQEWVATSHSPEPEGNFCVPCVSSIGGGGDLTGAAPGASFASPAPVHRAAAQGNGPSLILDLSSAGFEEPGQQLEALYLRVEDRFYPLLQRSAGQGAQLDQLAAGAFDRLVLQGFAFLLPSRGSQPSLIYLVRPQGSTELYWTSTPVLLAADAGHSLAGKP